MPSSRMFLAWCIFALPLASSLTPPLRSVGHRTTAGARFRLHAVDNENLEEKFDKLKEAQSKLHGIHLLALKSRLLLINRVLFFNCMHRVSTRRERRASRRRICS